MNAWYIASIIFGALSAFCAFTGRIEKPTPSISMNVDFNEQNPFNADFYVANGGKADAENVKVKIAYFDYYATPENTPTKTAFLLENLNESDNLSRNLGVVEANNGRVNARISDLVSYEDPDFALFEITNGTRLEVLSPTLQAPDNPTILVVSSNERERLEGSLVCFEVSYSWRNGNSFKQGKYNTGFLIDRKRNGFEKWIKRSEVCSKGFLEQRKASFPREKDNLQEIAE